jgi:hypothetical protein
MLQAEDPTSAYLGPAAGRQTVYEQRSRILFALGRAEARAAQQFGTVEQVSLTFF